MDKDAEIARLRDLLWENGIDPDPEEIVPEAPRYGPPTMMQHLMDGMLANAARTFVAQIDRWDQEFDFFNGENWPIGQTLKIRLPKDYIEKGRENGTDR